MADGKIDLIALIRDKKVTHFVIDNDCWSGYASKAAWENSEEPIIEDCEVSPLGDGGYGSGASYGGDVLQALAAVVGVTVESV